MKGMINYGVGSGMLEQLAVLLRDGSKNCRLLLLEESNESHQMHRCSEKGTNDYSTYPEVLAGAPRTRGGKSTVGK